MPELPDIELYVDGLRERILGRSIERVRVASPFLVRSVEPPLAAVEGRTIDAISRLGKRIVWTLEGDVFVVIHLMIAGRLRWKKRGTKPPGRIGLAAFDFSSGTLLLTEASKKKRASLHVVAGRAALGEHDRGGLEVLDSSPGEFSARLLAENHTLKRSLTDPRLFSGIGNAYSDEILHAARLSPIRLTAKLEPAEIARLHRATVDTLTRWRATLLETFRGRFPDAGDVTAFRDGFAVHGRYRQPCPVCGDPVQRIRYAENETNYCATCQTGGKLLADRSLSRLLKDDWPRSLDELDDRLGGGRKTPR
jgi:formamidopyrimidine-DNA glycosylase